jgi:hypothetical protein
VEALTGQRSARVSDPAGEPDRRSPALTSPAQRFLDLGNSDTHGRAMVSACKPYENDKIQLVAGHGKRVIEAAMRRTTRFPRVMPHHPWINSAIAQPAHNIRYTTAHHDAVPRIRSPHKKGSSWGILSAELPWHLIEKACYSVVCIVKLRAAFRTAPVRIGCRTQNSCAPPRFRQDPTATQAGRGRCHGPSQPLPDASDHLLSCNGGNLEKEKQIVSEPLQTSGSSAKRAELRARLGL